MVRVVMLLVTLLSVIMADLPSFQTETPPVPLDKLIYPNLIVKVLQPGCGTTEEGFPTFLGTDKNSVIISLNEEGAALCVNRSTMFKLALPADAKVSHPSWENFKYSGDKKQLIAVCAPDRGDVLLIDIRKRTMILVNLDRCVGTPRWSDDERFLYYQMFDGQETTWRAYDVQQKTLGTWTPPALFAFTDQKTEIIFTQKPEDEAKTCQAKTVGTRLTDDYSLITLRDVTTGKETLLACVQGRLIVKSRLDDGRLILVSSASEDATQAGLHELLLLDPKALQLTSVGLVALSGSYYDTSQYLILRSKAIVYLIKPRKIGDDKTPQDCALVSLDLTTFKETVFDRTQCDYPADLTYLPLSNEIMYLDYPETRASTSGDDAPPIPTLKLLELKTEKIIDLQTGGVQEIATVSPGERRYVMVISDPTLGGSARKFGDRLSLPDPHFTIFDSRIGNAVYENVFDGSSEWRWAFEWATDGNGFLFGHRGDHYVSLPDALAVQVDRGALSCTWEGTASCFRSYPQWSPGGRYVMIYTLEGIKVVRRADNRIIPITKTVEENDYVVIARWSSDEKLIVEAFPSTSEPILMSLRRWLVDPALAK